MTRKVRAPGGGGAGGAGLVGSDLVLGRVGEAVEQSDGGCAGGVDGESFGGGAEGAGFEEHSTQASPPNLSC